MTPEDTPRMAERTDRQAQIDPWDSVHEEFADMSQWETARVYRADAVDAARAADAALLRERDAQIASLQAANASFTAAATVRVEDAEAQIASLTAQVEQRERQKHDANCELRGPGGAVDRRCSCGFRALRAELTTLRAERDAAQQERDAERQRWMDARCREVEQSIRADRLEQALKNIRDHAEGSHPSALSMYCFTAASAALQSTRPQEQP